MDTIQLAATLTAPTGTGKIFIPYSSDADSAVFVEKNATGRPAKLVVKRAQPKPNGSFPGVERFEWKLTEYYTVNTIEYQAIIYGGCSIPVPIAQADRTSLFTRGALIASDNVVKNGVSSNLIPL